MTLVGAECREGEASPQEGHHESKLSTTGPIQPAQFEGEMRGRGPPIRKEIFLGGLMSKV